MCAGVVMQPLVSRYCTTVPIRPLNYSRRATAAGIAENENHAHTAKTVNEGPPVGDLSCHALAADLIRTSLLSGA